MVSVVNSLYWRVGLKLMGQGNYVIVLLIGVLNVMCMERHLSFKYLY